MFITNQADPAQLLEELFRVNERLREETHAFEPLRHDRDLCPRFQRNIEVLLEAYAAYFADVHDTQGFNDKGVDVLLRFNDEERGRRRIGLQIKSWSEIEDWKLKKAPDFMKTLRNQVYCAQRDAGCEEVLVVLCADDVRHKKQVRSITADLSNDDQVKIMTPQKALGFFWLDETYIRTLVARTLCKSDPLIRDALEALGSYPADTAYVALGLLCHAFEEGPGISDSQIVDIFERWQEQLAPESRKPGRLEKVVSQLDNDILSYSDSHRSVRISDLPTALCALYFDQRHRFGGDLLETLALLLEIEPDETQKIRREP
jgi:hypothetical protein